MRSPLVLMVLPIALAGLLLTGCGKSEEDQVRSDAKALVTAMVDGDAKTFCSLIDEKSQKELTSAMAMMSGKGEKAGDCSDLAKLYSDIIKGDKTQAKELNATKDKIDQAEVTIKGDTATLKIKGEKDVLKAHRQGDKWVFDLNS